MQSRSQSLCAQVSQNYLIFSTSINRPTSTGKELILRITQKPAIWHPLEFDEMKKEAAKGTVGKCSVIFGKGVIYNKAW